MVAERFETIYVVVKTFKTKKLTSENHLGEKEVKFRVSRIIKVVLRRDK